MPRILTLDIETSPILAHVWGTRNVDIALNQIIEPTRMICFAAKWHDSNKVLFYSEHHHGRETMVAAARELLDEATIVVHFNGRTFDMPHLYREILLAELPPPSPVLEVDLLVASRKFRFASHKLQHLTTQLGLAGKVQHEGHGLWVKCLEGDPAAWGRMRRYNIQDVRVTEQLYDLIRPWIKAHPHLGLLNGVAGDSCSRCGGTDLERRGFAYTPRGAFQQYRCRGCGAWSRSGKSVARVDVAGIA